MIGGPNNSTCNKAMSVQAEVVLSIQAASPSALLHSIQLWTGNLNEIH